MEHKERKILEGRYYLHFKGNLYKVIGIATNPETEEKMVVYQAQYLCRLSPSEIGNFPIVPFLTPPNPLLQ